MLNSLIITTSNDPFTRGLDYLYGVRSLALEPDMVDRVYDLDQRNSVCTWIGEQIDAINTQLTSCIEACHNCVHPWEQPSIQIFAAPLAQSYGLDALCNFQTSPISILIDVGRMMPKDWLLVVAHEYAHAHVGFPGHHQSFARSLTHLCLGLGIAPPPHQPGLEENLRFYPTYPPIQDPLAFWRGEKADWRSYLTNSHSHSMEHDASNLFPRPLAG